MTAAERETGWFFALSYLLALPFFPLFASAAVGRCDLFAAGLLSAFALLAFMSTLLTVFSAVPRG